jgi:uncharacterized membrane protein YobD (UPF0266 family)
VRELYVTDAPAAPGRHERMVVFALCMFAASRVFFFSAVFPFFNNVDEPSHFDLVRKYARGHVPGGIEPFDAGAARDILLYGSPEYLVAARRFPGGNVPPPVWALPSNRIREALEIRVRETPTDLNYESTQPPLYYAVAGAWRRLGEALGLRGGQALYWIRFMNVMVCALLVWLAHSFARTLLPDRGFLRLGMPFVVAFFPQDVLYSVSNDVLMPLVGGAALWALFVVARGRAGGYAFHTVAGLLVAAVILVKPSGVPVAFIAMAALAIVVLRAEAGKRSAAIYRSAALLLAAGAPLAVWGLHNAFALGDVTGSGAKALGSGICGGLGLGWSLKPPGAVFHHPLFSAGGLVTFWHETMTSFWRGEFTWGRKRIASGGWDLFYSVSSLVLPAAAIVALVIRRRSVARGERLVLWLSLATLLLSLLFLAVVSLIFDFDGCFYPSRAHPFLTSGRIALAALLPFLALYLTGLETLLPGRRAARLRWALLIAVATGMTFSEVSMSRGALHSAYNWFHLVHARGGQGELDLRD